MGGEWRGRSGGGNVYKFVRSRVAQRPLPRAGGWRGMEEGAPYCACLTARDAEAVSRGEL